MKWLFSHLRQTYRGEVGRSSGVGRGLGVGADLGVGAGVGVGVAVGVSHEIGSHPLIVTVSTRQPSLAPLLSLAIRQRNLISKEIVPKLTMVVMKPFELPLQA